MSNDGGPAPLPDVDQDQDQDQDEHEHEHEAPVIIGRDDGVWLHAGAAQPALQAAADALFQAGSLLAGLDYDIFLRMLYGAGPELPAECRGQPLVRVADAIVPFPPARRALYKTAKIDAGAVIYPFERVLFANAHGMPELTMLDFDEFVADMWSKGIRFGIDAHTVRAVIEAGGRARIVVARRLEPVAGRNAAFVEVSPHLHQSNAPRELANGRFDLHAFENRFPQVKAQVRLLRKDPCTAGTRGIELSGEPIEAKDGMDRELTDVAGAGTVIEYLDGHDHLVSAVEGFINVDRRNGRLSIGPKIVGRDGVSVRTTGNLQLAGEYEEFGDVHEHVIVEGSGITIHGDVFGHIASRGGTVQLKRNLMGGSVVNAAGAIGIGRVAANAVLQAQGGEVTIREAQNCVISAARVTIGAATNCEIVADEVVIGIASGCAIAARNMALTVAGPRKGSEMLLFALLPDTRQADEALADLTARAARCQAMADAHSDTVNELRGRQDVGGYLALSARVRAGEVTLTAAQQALFRKMAEQLAPALNEIAQVSLAGNGARAQFNGLQGQLDMARRRRSEIATAASCTVKVVDGDTVLRTMLYHPDTGPPTRLAAKDIKAHLRAGSWSHAPVLRAADGALDWSSR